MDGWMELPLGVDVWVNSVSVSFLICSCHQIHFFQSITEMFQTLFSCVQEKEADTYTDMLLHGGNKSQSEIPEIRESKDSKSRLTNKKSPVWLLCASSNLTHINPLSQIFHPNGNAALHFHTAFIHPVCPICHSAPVATQIGLPLSLSSE